ncbi:MAG: hypothetical protein OXF62_12490, partial [Caldilineaceae bacterium]|nr:hypothetical protein [Caldilineaceae bacterium]
MTSKQFAMAWAVVTVAALFLIACNPMVAEPEMLGPGVERGPSCCEKIAFVSDREGNKDIYVMDSDGSNVVRLTHDSADDYSPEWSPDGSRIMFLSDRYDRTELYVLNADGSNVSLLVSDFSGSRSLVWSPDGKRIAFYGQPGGNPDIYVVNVDSSGIIRLTDHPQVDVLPSWSPDA